MVAAEPSAEWKFDVTGYFRAPMRLSWGPAHDGPKPRRTTGDAVQNPGTQFRSPPLVPDANYIDWRYTNSFVAPWTELNFHYGNDRVKATVQIASYNITDPGYRRLESNLGINLAFLTMLWPELGGNENFHLTATVGGFANRYGAAGRYDAGKYETYLFGRTHVAGETPNLAYDVGDDWTVQAEESFGAKLEPIPFYGPPKGTRAAHLLEHPRQVRDVRQSLPAGTRTRARRQWRPSCAPPTSARCSRRMLILGAHCIDTFANDNERSTAYQGFSSSRNGRHRRRRRPTGTTRSRSSRPWASTPSCSPAGSATATSGYSHL